MKIILLLLTLKLGLIDNLNAQQPAQQDSVWDVKEIGDVVLSATKFGIKKKNIAQHIDVITNHFINKVNTQNTGDLLISTAGNVFVQKSQQGGSSPVIRMNNAIYRAGHLQNVITKDQNMLDRVEVMYGPSSTLYGSDALGGTIFMVSKPVKLAEFSPGEKFYGSDPK